jgi:N-terminal acetyltransferase B complex non-catalytic subunit
MAGIFKRQNRCVELHDLWDAPPKPLEPVLDLHRQDILTLMTKALLEQEEWPLLEKLCLATIEETLSNTSSKDVPKLGLWELCARRWDLWNALLRVVFATRSKQE